jgi:hypothetical protein
MENTEHTIVHRMAVAIDRHLASGEYKPKWDDDLSDDAFIDAYEELSRRLIPFKEIKRVLERTRWVRDECFHPFVFQVPDEVRRVWTEEVRWRLLGYFAMCRIQGASPPNRRDAASQARVRFDDSTWRIFVDDRPYFVDDVQMYQMWKIVFEAGLNYVSEKEIMKKMDRKVPLTIHKRRSKLPPDLNEMLAADPELGYSIRLPRTLNEQMRDFF